MSRWVPAFLGFLVFPGAAAAAHSQEPVLRGEPEPARPREAPRQAPGLALEFTWTTPRWRGVELRAGALSGACRLEVPDGLETKSNGFNPPLVERLEYDEMDYEGVGGGLVVDLDFFQLSVDYFEGTWEGEGGLVVDDGLSTPTRTPIDVEGEFRALKVGLTWPAVRIAGDGFEFSLGADLKTGGFQMYLDPVTSGPLPMEDRVDLLVGFAGPRAAFRFLAGPVEFSLEGAHSWVFGSSRGTAQEVGAGVGLRF